MPAAMPRPQNPTIIEVPSIPLRTEPDEQTPDPARNRIPFGPHTLPVAEAA